MPEPPREPRLGFLQSQERMFNIGNGIRIPTEISTASLETATWWPLPGTLEKATCPENRGCETTCYLRHANKTRDMILIKNG